MVAPEDLSPEEAPPGGPGERQSATNVREAVFGDGGPLPAARLGQRFIAFSLDVLLVGAFIGLILFRFVLPEFYPSEYQELMQWYQSTSDSIEEGETPLQSMERESLPEPIWKLMLFIQNFIVMGFWLYFGVCESFFQGKTLGKRVFRLKVVGIRNLGHLNLGPALLRSLLKTLCLFTLFPLFLISFVLVFFVKYRRAGHDLVSQSIVIEDNLEIVEAE